MTVSGAAEVAIWRERLGEAEAWLERGRGGSQETYLAREVERIKARLSEVESRVLGEVAAQASGSNFRDEPERGLLM